MDPQHDDRLQALLRTLSMRSLEDQERILDKLARDRPPPAVGNGQDATERLRVQVPLPPRFQIVRRIGQGGFGTVYEAYDAEAGRHVALKVLRHAHPDSLFRFKQEFRVLADLRHPNLVELYDLFQFEEAWFFTMELVSGETFVQHVRRAESCDLVRLRKSVETLIRVLDWMHAHEVVHRDIKPDNVIVTEYGRLVLLDFGLARHLSSHANSATVSVGTPAYMAPEQLTDVPVSAAADLYAVGALIYTALTGKPPFEGAVLQVLNAKSSQDPAPPSSIAKGVPQDWERICCKLLDRRPEARPAAPDLLAWLAGETEPVLAAPSSRRIFVGRDDLVRNMLTICEAPPALLEISGPSGYGKSALLHAFADAACALHPNAMVIRGRCYEHESVPFKALDPLVDDLSRHLQRMGSAQAGPLLPPDVPALARLFPVLGRAGVVAGMLRSSAVEIANAAELRRRAFVAFAALLERICANHLLIVCLDDAQWGDSDSAALFQQLYARHPVPPFVLAVTHRAGDQSEFLRLLRHYAAKAEPPLKHSVQSVGPLEPAAARELALALLERHRLHAEDPNALAAGCEGNPLLLEQVVAGIARSAVPGTELRKATLAELVLDRVSRLSSAAREFLEMLACLGEPLPEAIALRLPAAASGECDAVTSGVMASLVSDNLIRLKDSGGLRAVELYHDQIRAALVQAVPEPARRELHIRVADTLISAGYSDQGVIAVQLARGGDHIRAACYAERAAEAAEEVLAFERAAHFYGIALALGSYDREQSANLHERLAQAYASAGRGADSARAYEAAAALVPDRDRHVELRRHAAEQWIRGGNIRQGISLLVSLGSEFNISHSESRVAALASIATSRLALRIRGLGYRERSAGEIPRRDLARLDVYWALTCGLSLWNPMMGAAYQLKHLRLALRAGEPRRIAVALATESAYRCLAGERAYAGARSLLNESLTTGQRLADPTITGTAHALGAMCGWLTGRWDVARDSGLHGEKTLREQCGAVSWELSVARNAALGGLLWSGDWIDYAARLNDWTRDAEDRSDLVSLSTYRMNHCPLSLASDDPDRAAADLDEAEQILAQSWSGRGFHVPHFFGVFGLAGVLLYRGASPGELEQLERRIGRLRRSLLVRIEIVAVLTAVLDALLYIRLAAELPARRPILLRKAGRCAAQLRNCRAIWALGMGMLIEAGIEATLGRADAAAARWSDAERELTRSGMRMYAAAAQLCRGRASHDESAVLAAEEAFRQRGVRSPVRFATSLAPGMPG